jgi:hypothetical protein
MAFFFYLLQMHHMKGKKNPFQSIIFPRHGKGLQYNSFFYPIDHLSLRFLPLLPFDLLLNQLQVFSFEESLERKQLSNPLFP